MTQHKPKHLTQEHQSQAGKARAAQSAFVDHNRSIATSGYAGYSAHMRAPSGLRLLDPAHIQFLRPEELGCAMVDGPPPPRQQRLWFGRYVWQAVWAHLPGHPPPPSDEVYLREMVRVQALVGKGQPLVDPLDVIYVAPSDYCDQHGTPLPKRKQRKCFRDALAAACQAALQAQTSHVSKPGQRRPMSDGRSPSFQSRRPVAQDVERGRPDLPPYAAANVAPQRPYTVPTAASMAAIWLPPQEDETQDDL